MQQHGVFFSQGNAASPESRIELVRVEMRLKYGRGPRRLALALTGALSTARS